MRYDASLLSIRGSKADARVASLARRCFRWLLTFTTSAKQSPVPSPCDVRLWCRAAKSAVGVAEDAVVGAAERLDSSDFPRRPRSALDRSRDCAGFALEVGGLAGEEQRIGNRLR